MQTIAALRSIPAYGRLKKSEQGAPAGFSHMAIEQWCHAKLRGEEQRAHFLREMSCLCFSIIDKDEHLLAVSSQHLKAILLARFTSALRFAANGLGETHVVVCCATRSNQLQVFQSRVVEKRILAAIDQLVHVLQISTSVSRRSSCSSCFGLFRDFLASTRFEKLC